MGFVWVHADSFLLCVASPFHSFVTTLNICRSDFPSADLPSADLPSADLPSADLPTMPPPAVQSTDRTCMYGIYRAALLTCLSFVLHDVSHLCCMTHLAATPLHLPVWCCSVCYPCSPKLVQAYTQTNADQTSNQTQAGIGHSAPTHRGGIVQNRIKSTHPPGQNQTRSVGGATTH